MNMHSQIDWFITGKKPIFQYVKRNRKKIGILVAGIYEDEICFGWSLCSRRDKFDREKGFTLADSRCATNERYANRESYEVIPQSILKSKALRQFLFRINSYYKPISEPGFQFNVNYSYFLWDLLSFYGVTNEEGEREEME
jgi:hypothetical protein